MSEKMRFYCPHKGCSAELTDQMRNPANYLHLEELFDGKLVCPSCGKYVRPTHNIDLYWDQKVKTIA